jgi:hypothetical protein
VDQRSTSKQSTRALATQGTKRAQTPGSTLRFDAKKMMCLILFSCFTCAGALKDDNFDANPCDVSHFAWSLIPILFCCIGWLRKGANSFAVVCGLACLVSFICSVSIASQVAVSEVLHFSFAFSYQFAFRCSVSATRTALHFLHPDSVWIWLCLSGAVLCDFALGWVAGILHKRTSKIRKILPARKIAHQRICPPRGKRFALRARFCFDMCIFVCPRNDTTVLHEKTGGNIKYDSPNFSQINSLELRGGSSGGGSAATRRKRDERDLLKGLKELLQSFAPQNKATAPPSQGKKNQGRKNQSLLGALKTLIARAEKNHDDLLPKLAKLVAAADDGKIPILDQSKETKPGSKPDIKTKPMTKTKTDAKQPVQSHQTVDTVKIGPGSPGASPNLTKLAEAMTLRSQSQICLFSIFGEIPHCHIM